MKYYTIDWDDNLDVIGHHPQTTPNKDCFFGSPNGVHQVKPNVLADFNPILKLDLAKKAKLTDYLNSFATSIGMIINDRFKSCLEEGLIPEHAFYQATIFKKKAIYGYHWFHFIVSDFWNWIDKDKSRAVIVDNKKNFQTVDKINLNLSVDKMIDFFYNDLPYYQNPKWEKIVFKKGFPKYDVYQVKTIEFRTIISEKLLESLKKINATGFTTKLYDIIELED